MNCDCFLHVSGFTGIDSEYEKPEAPELVLKTDSCSVNESIQQLIDLLHEKVRETTSSFIHPFIHPLMWFDINR